MDLISLVVSCLTLRRISDLRNVDKMTFNFELGKPFRPYEQLMGVLPVASKDHIPLAFQVSVVPTQSTLVMADRLLGSDV